MPTPTPLPTQPLRDEHADLFPQLELLREAADALDERGESSRSKLDAAYAFLAEHLLIHAQAEEAVLYPVVAREMGAPQATATMSRDHVAITRLVEALGELRAQAAAEGLSADRVKALRRVLYGLHVLVAVHFAKEEEIYLPLLDARLTGEQVREMYAEMEAAAGAARH